MPFSNPVVGGNGTLVRSWMQSEGFVAGASGWRISRNGDAEFNSVTIRGTVESSNYVPGVSGWHIDDNGTAEFNDVTIRGTVFVQNGNAELSLISGQVGDTYPGSVYFKFNADTTLYDDGYIVPYGYDATHAGVFVTSGDDIGANGASSEIELRSSTLSASHRDGLIDLRAYTVHTTGFVFADANAANFEFADSASPTPGNSTTVVSVDVEVNEDMATAFFRITGNWNGVAVTGPVAFPGNRGFLRLTRNGTILAYCRVLPGNTTLGQMGGTIVTEDAPGAGTHTYALVLHHGSLSTATSMRVTADSDGPACILVEGF